MRNLNKQQVAKLKKQGHMYEAVYFDTDGNKIIKYVSAGDDSRDLIEELTDNGYKVIVK